MTKILSIVSQETGIDTRSLLEKTRRHEVVWGRFVAMHLGRSNGFKLREIKSSLGGMNHANVIYGASMVTLRRSVEPDFDARVKRIEQLVKEAL